MLWGMRGCRLLAVVAALAVAGCRVAAAPRPARGMLLVATDRTRDTGFEQTVILLLVHEPTRSIGLVINRRLGEPVSTAFPDLRRAPAGGEPLWAGGPVAIGINALIRAKQPAADASPVAPGIFLISERARMRELLARGGKTEEIRVYAGMCSWGPG